MKISPKSPAPWDALVSRIVLDSSPCDDSPPYGFATRIVSQWRAARREAALQRWSFWSLRAALCSVAVCGWFVISGSSERETSVLIEPPTAEFVKVPFSAR